MKPFYDDGQVTIYHGDCREMDLRALGDVIVTDPPYGIDYKHGWENRDGWVAPASVPIAGDSAPFDPSHMLQMPRLILWGANHYADRLPASAGWLVWDKRDGIGHNDQSDCELAWTSFLTTARVYTARWNGALRQGREQREGRVHVSQKPVALMQWCLRLESGGGTVVDPYMGSGSTLIAARELGRRAVGIELEERYCAIAAERLAQIPLLTSAVG